MKASQRQGKKISEYFIGRIDASKDSIIFFRITTGLIFIIHFVAILKDFDLLYGIESIIPTDIHIVYANKNILFFDEIISFLTQFTKDRAFSLLVFKTTYITLGVFITIGFFSRFSSFFLLILQISLVKSSYFYAYGADFFASMSLLYLILLPSDGYFSIRNFFRKVEIKTDFTLVKITFQIHICIAYFVSGAEKLSGYNWRNGESVWKALHLPNFTNDFHLDIDYWGKYPVIFVLMGWATIIIELMYPLFITLKKTRILWLSLTISLHLGIALTLNLYFFSAILITWNITNFYFIDKKI